MSSPLTIYLRNHEAAARGGYDLFRRAAAHQQRRPWGDQLVGLRDEVGGDLRSLRTLMRELRVLPDPVLGQVMRVGERIGRLKPNGHLLTRSPLSDLIEIEGAQDAVHAKATGWQALLAAEVRVTTVDLAALAERAVGQRERLLELHRRAAAVVLPDRSGR